MDFLRALTFGLVLALLGALGQPAHAAFTVQPVWKYGPQTYCHAPYAITATDQHENLTALGNILAGHINATQAPGGGQPLVANCGNGGLARVNRVNESTGQIWFYTDAGNFRSAGEDPPWTASKVNGCPSNSTGTTSCTCNSGYQENPTHTGCVAVPTGKEAFCQSLVGKSVGGTYTYQGPKASPVCVDDGYYASYGDGGCAAIPKGFSVTMGVPQSDGTTKIFSQTADATFTGAVCQGGAATAPTPSPGASAPLSPASAPDTTPTVCTNGQLGTVNGISTCVPYPPGTTVTTNDAKSATTTNADGTKTKVDVTQDTQCANGNCTTTTTTTTTNYNSSGTQTGTSTTATTATDSKLGFCTSNPGSAQCRGTDDSDSSFTGSCAGGFTFEGDAIQGAIAREIHMQDCKWNATTAESAAYDAEKSKVGSQTSGLPGSSTVAFGVDQYDTSNALGAGACLTDQTVAMPWGGDVAIPYSRMCDWVSFLRLGLLALASLAWLLIVFKGNS